MLQTIHRLQEASQDVHLDLDAQLNKIIPPSPLWRLPRPISHFLGYRTKPPPDVGNVLIAASALVGTFVGLLCVSSVARYSEWISEHHPPVLLASLGAAAVLEYNTMLSPLAQPRNSIIGHTVAAFIGVCFGKLMLLAPDEATAANRLSWILAPLACGTASAVMTLTNCIYPPGGATAILAVADPTVRGMGWYLILLVFIFSLLMLGTACAVNNIIRRYPLFWWTPHECGQVYRRRRSSDIEKLSPTKQDFSSEESIAPAAAHELEHRDIARALPAQVGPPMESNSIVLSGDGVINLPHHVQLAEYERAVLQDLLARLQQHNMAPNFGRAVTEQSWSEKSDPP